MKTTLKVTGLVLSGIIAGMAIALLILWQNAPKVMIIEDASPYNFTTTAAKLEESVTKEGWKIAAVHDLQKSMKKYNKEVLPVKVYEICHPDHAEKILAQSEERVVSSLMPCRVAVYEKADGTTYISRMNTGLMGKMMEGIVPEVMDAASLESENIITRVLN